MYLWIEAMELPFWHFEGVKSGMHHAPEQLRLSLKTAKCCQGTINNMLLQNMVELGCGPPSAWVISPICFVGKPQSLLQILTNLFSQLRGQPEQDRVTTPECIVSLHTPTSLGKNTKNGHVVVGPGGGQNPVQETQFCWA
jgi:hypothetical protein